MHIAEISVIGAGYAEVNATADAGSKCSIILLARVSRVESVFK